MYCLNVPAVLANTGTLLRNIMTPVFRFSLAITGYLTDVSIYVALINPKYTPSV
jgi:hypothetical protein